MKVALIFLAVMSAWCLVKGGHNVTQLLEGNPEYSTLNTLLTQSGLAAQINSRISVTLLAPPNVILDSAISQLDPSQITPQAIYFILSFHVLLHYYDMSKLTSVLPPHDTTLVPTLYQTSDNTNAKESFLNITRVAATQIRAGPAFPPNGPLPVALTADVYAQSSNFSIINIDGVLIPPGVVGVSIVQINITQLITQNKNYSTFLALVTQWGLLPTLESRTIAPGETVLLPTNEAFTALPKEALATLTMEQKVKIMLYHIVPTFYSFETLASLVGSPVKTLASSPTADDFTFTILSIVHGPFVISTGLNIANIGEALYNWNPLSLFGIDTVLLPLDIFGAIAPSFAPIVVQTYPSAPPSSPPSSSSSSPSTKGGSLVDSSEILVDSSAMFLSALRGGAFLAMALYLL